MMGRRQAGTSIALAGMILVASCGTANEAAHSLPAAQQRPEASLNTSVATAGDTWAVALMGGSAAQHNNFWQLFALETGSAHWKLVTPPGTADNGGLVLAPAGPTVVTAFLPSQYLRFTPLIQTSDGKAWASLSPLDGPLASVPDALAARPGGGMLAVLTTGTVTMAAHGGSGWRTLTSRRSLSATPAGRRCDLTALTAAAFTPSGTPLLGGTCAHRGTAGIFAEAGGTWQLTGPDVPALAGQDISVLRLVQVGRQTVALLAAGRAPGASLVAAWSNADGRWTLSPPLTLGRAGMVSASFGTGGVIEARLAGRRGATVAPGGGWQPLPELPPGTATLASGPGGAVDALAVHRATLTVWRTTPGALRWTMTQHIIVPIPFGSSS